MHSCTLKKTKYFVSRSTDERKALEGEDYTYSERLISLENNILRKNDFIWEVNFVERLLVKTIEHVPWLTYICFSLMILANNPAVTGYSCCYSSFFP